MFTQIGAKPESDFSDPLGMLGDCHKRILFFLNDLVRLAESAPSAPLDSAQRAALERALRYFQESGPRHTADEEESLFPRLAALHDERVDELLAKINLLEADHASAELVHLEIDAIGVCWLADGLIRDQDATRLKSLLRGLSRMYEHHLAIEDRAVFPSAATLLSDHQKTEIGREMAKRRGLSPEIVRDSLKGAPQPSNAKVEVQA
ncbi:MAG TPA: hemerythrin domain-containing protein [Acidobacteriaceae bacterium]